MCPSGFKLAEDWKTCVDVDECATMASVREECGGEDLCKNTEGSYECLNGTTTSPELPHPVDPLVSGGSPEEHLCDEGYHFDYERSVCVDVDECSEGEADCGGEGVTCVNLDPGYECVCGEGQRYDDHACVEVDECAETPGLCGPHGDCVDGKGAAEYSCDCHPGFRLDGGTCVDVDECEDRCLENGRCTNEVGSFSCDCKPGFTLDEDGENCVDVDECVEMAARGGRRPCGRAM